MEGFPQLSEDIHGKCDIFRSHRKSIKGKSNGEFVHDRIREIRENMALMEVDKPEV